MAGWIRRDILGLALRARRRLLNNNPDRFVRATLFLHGDFKPEYYYWASVELVQRSILTGWVLLVSADKSFLRLIVSFMTSLAVLVWTLIASPYRRGEDNLLAGASCLLLVLTYVCAASWLTKILRTQPTRNACWASGRPTVLSCCLIIFAFVLLTIMILSVLSRLHTESRVQIYGSRERRATEAHTESRPALASVHKPYLVYGTGKGGGSNSRTLL
jgi:hypothetical protein